MEIVENKDEQITTSASTTCDCVDRMCKIIPAIKEFESMQTIAYFMMQEDRNGKLRKFTRAEPYGLQPTLLSTIMLAYMEDCMTAEKQVVELQKKIEDLSKEEYGRLQTAIYNIMREKDIDAPHGPVVSNYTELYNFSHEDSAAAILWIAERAVESATVIRKMKDNQEKALINFGNYLLSQERYDRLRDKTKEMPELQNRVTDADLKNWQEEFNIESPKDYKPKNN